MNRSVVSCTQCGAMTPAQCQCQNWARPGGVHLSSFDEVATLRQQLAEANELREKAEREVENLKDWKSKYTKQAPETMWNRIQELEAVVHPDMSCDNCKWELASAMMRLNRCGNCSRLEVRPDNYEALNPPTADSEKGEGE